MNEYHCFVCDVIKINNFYWEIEVFIHNCTEDKRKSGCIQL